MIVSIAIAMDCIRNLDVNWASATPFGGLLGSRAEEGRAKPRYYSV